MVPVQLPVAVHPAQYSVPQSARGHDAHDVNSGVPVHDVVVTGLHVGQ